MELYVVSLNKVAKTSKNVSSTDVGVCSGTVAHWIGTTTSSP